MSTKPTRSQLLLSRSQLAAVFGVTPQRITIWKSSGMPVADRGARGRESRFDLPAVNGWWLRRELEARGIGKGGGKPIDLVHERAILARAQAQRVLLDVRTRAKQLLPRDQVVREGQAFVAAVKAKLRALPRRLAQAGLIPRETEPAVAGIVREALEEMSRWKTELDLLEAAKEGDGNL